MDLPPNSPPSDHTYPDPSVAAFGLADTLVPGVGAWHCHDHHQILYVSDGAVRLELADATWFLPASRAAWLRAGTEHRVDVAAPAELRTIYLEPPMMPSLPNDCGVFGVTSLAREMLVQGAQWGPSAATDLGLAPVSQAFFRAFAALVGMWVRDSLPFALPRATTPELARATKYVLGHLDTPLDASDIARAAALSTRTLTRRFHAELGLTLRAWIHHARMLRAVEGLTAGGSSITEIALDCGYSSLPTFSRQFAAFTGETPRAYRKRTGSPRTREAS